MIRRIVEAKTQWYIVQEDDTVFNVFSSDDFDENGDLIGYENQEGYNIHDYDIVAVCDSESEAFKLSDKLTRDAEDMVF